MTVREYLEFVAELKKVPKKERKQQIDEVMEMTQITDMQQRLIRNLSKGYRQRVDWRRQSLATRRLSFWMSPR